MEQEYYTNIFYFDRINKIGGVETFFYEIAKKYCDNVLFVFVPPNGSVYPSIVILQFVYLALDKSVINVFRAVFAASTSSYDPTLNSEPAGNDAFSTVVVVWVEICLVIVFVSTVTIWH